MTHPQVFGQKFTPIRRFLVWKTDPFWPHIPNMTQYGNASPRVNISITKKDNKILWRSSLPLLSQINITKPIHYPLGGDTF